MHNFKTVIYFTVHITACYFYCTQYDILYCISWLPLVCFVVTTETTQNFVSSLKKQRMTVTVFQVSFGEELNLVQSMICCIFVTFEFWPTLYDICVHIFIDRTHLVRPWLVVYWLPQTCQHFLLHSYNNINAFFNFNFFFCECLFEKWGTAIHSFFCWKMWIRIL